MIEDLWYLYCSLLLELKRVFEVEKDINSNMLKASSGSLMHLTRNMMSSSSSQYIKGSKCKEISRECKCELVKF